MKRSLAFFVFILALGVFAPFGAEADEGETAFVSFTLNGEESDVELSSDTPEVEISVSAPEEARFTRLYICPESADPCDGASAIKFFSPNATTTSFTRSWEGLAASDEPVESGVYHLTVRFFRYGLSPDAFEETAPYTITVLGEEDDEDEGDVTDNPPPALSTLRWTPFTEDPETGEREYGETVVFADDAEEAVPFSTPGEISIETDFPAFGLEATLFYIPDPDSPTREFVASFGGFPNGSGGFSFPFDELAWSTPGVYELDLYEIETPVLVQAPLWQRMLGWFVGYEAHAAEHATLIDRIRFTVLEEIELPPEPEYAECCSSVIFLPGIKGSRLYVEENGEENQLWEPGLLEGNEDVRALFLNEDGTSIGNVYTKQGDILDSAGGGDYYASLITDMDALVSDGAIADWEPLAYDWRLSLNDIVSQGAEIDGKIYYSNATSTPYIEQTLRALAQKSQTGKVTIVAHSNGGLVAKLLIDRLQGDAMTLIDDVVFVGVPQSGAPQTIGALLYGYREGIPAPFPVVVNKQTARELAENSPMAYHLLPSDQYFNDVRDINHPVGLFSGTNTYEKERAAYGSLIGNWEELAAFLSAEEGGRKKPDVSEVDQANVLNNTLLAYADELHDSLDPWTPPDGVNVHQLAGWGIDTIAGIEFYDLSVLSAGTSVPYYKPIIVEDGDGIVPVPSALMMSTSTERVEQYWFDLFEYEELHPKEKKTHGNFLEIADVRTFLKNLIQNSTEYPGTILSEQPQANESSKKLRFFLHSPLTLTVLDAGGNIVGEYDEFGDVKYVTVPQGVTYTLSLTGLDTGTFTLEIEEIENGTTVASSTLANIPVLEGTTATLTISDGLSTASSLSVDVDGDGEEDITLSPQAGETVFYQASTAETQEQPTPTPAGGGPLWSAPIPAPQVLGVSTSTSSTIITQESIKPLPLPFSTTTTSNQQEQIIVNPTLPGHTLELQVTVESIQTQSTLQTTTTQSASTISAASQQPWFTKVINTMYDWISDGVRIFFIFFR